MDEGAQNISPEEVYKKARELLAELEKQERSNGLLIAYNPDTEKFQFLSLNADVEEIFALLLGGMGMIKKTIVDMQSDRTLN